MGREEATHAWESRLHGIWKYGPASLIHKRIREEERRDREVRAGYFW